MFEFFGVHINTIFEHVREYCNIIMVHKLVKYIQNFKRESLCNTYFNGLSGRQTQGPPRAAHTLATPLGKTPSYNHFAPPSENFSCLRP